jgi:hypothetical protein
LDSRIIFLLENIMKTKSITFTRTLLALALSLSALSAMAAPAASILGQPEPVTAGNRVITITPDTKYVNITGGQTVQFNSGGKSFAWDFNGPIYSFNLNRVAPPGTLDHTVIAYVAPDPLYAGH